MNGTELRTDERINEQTNEHMDEWKDENYIPLGINAGGIIRNGAKLKKLWMHPVKNQISLCIQSDQRFCWEHYRKPRNRSFFMWTANTDQTQRQYRLILLFIVCISLCRFSCVTNQSYELRHDKTNDVAVCTAKTQISPSSDAQADLSLRWAQTHFVGFVMSWLIFSLMETIALFMVLFFTLP